MNQLVNEVQAMSQERLPAVFRRWRERHDRPLQGKQQVLA